MYNLFNRYIDKYIHIYTYIYIYQHFFANEEDCKTYFLFMSIHVL